MEALYQQPFGPSKASLKLRCSSIHFQ
jgi:hypothetical protein